METKTDRNICLLDRLKIQAELLIPLPNDLRNEPGAKNANKIVFKSLRYYLKS